MKTKIILLMAVAISIIACKDAKKETPTEAQVVRTNYKITGNLTGFTESQIYLMYRDAEMKSTIDTTAVMDGKFEFNGSVPFPAFAMLYNKDRSKMTQFYIENTDISVSGSLLDAVIKGGEAQQQYVEYTAYMKPTMDKINAMNEKYKGKEGEVDKDEFEKVYEDKWAKQFQYVKEHPNTYVSLNEMGLLTHMMPPVELKEVFDKLNPDLKNTDTGKAITERLNILMKSAVGVQAMDFTQNSVAGKPITFSEFSKGKYVLIDFWASWCGPCRAENPNVLAAYKKYNPKGFDVISVSIDDNEDKWKQAIKEDGMPWMHVSDLKGKENEVAVMYGIQAVPTTILVNPEGQIIARNLRGKALHKKLAEVMHKMK